MLGARTYSTVDHDDKNKPTWSKLMRSYRIFWSRRMHFGLGILAMVALAWFGVWLDKNYDLWESVHVSCLPNQPRVQVQPNFMESSVFEIMHTELPHHPLLGSNPLSDTVFNNSMGWVVYFNKEGLVNLGGNPHYRSMLPYVSKVLNPESNAFVFNLLVSAQNLDRNAYAVETHVDDTLGIAHPKKWLFQDVFLAHQVDVLYTNLPEDMVGGELEIWPADIDEPGSDAGIVAPAQNMHVQFRGDSLHRVKSFSSPSGKPRISLVLEQYRIPKKYYHLTTTYCEGSGCSTQ